jgi:hypothetical protein
MTEARTKLMHALAAAALRFGKVPLNRSPASGARRRWRVPTNPAVQFCAQSRCPENRPDADRY